MNKTITLALLITVTTPIASFAQTDDGLYKGKTPTEQTTKKEREFDSACVTNAITLREDALVVAFTKFASVQNSLMNARKADLIAALSKDTARQRTDARKAAWKEYRTANRNNQDELKKARQQAWATFKTSTSTCTGGRAEMSGDQSPGGSATEAI